MSNQLIFKFSRITYILLIFGCSDGQFQITGQTSELGRYLDHLSDLIGDILILSALAYPLDLLFTPMVIGMIFMHLAESYISYLAGFTIEKNDTKNLTFLFLKST